MRAERCADRFELLKIASIIGSRLRRTSNNAWPKSDLADIFPTAREAVYEAVALLAVTWRPARRLVM